MEDVTSE